MAKHESRDNQVAVVAWTRSGDEAPSYVIALPPGGDPARQDAVLVFDAADGGETPGANRAGRHRPAPEPIDFTLEVVDAAGNRGRLALSTVRAIYPQLEAHLGKAAFFSPVPASEPVLQHIEVPLAAFRAAEPALKLDAMTEIRFVFDRTPTASLVLDGIGLRTPWPTASPSAAPQLAR